jgi:hypothetical protein
VEKKNMQNMNIASDNGRSLQGPLGIASDMPSRWGDVELGFDEAAERIVRAHRHDGEHRDLPIVDMKTWAVVPSNGKFALAPLAGHHEPKPLRGNAFGNLMSRLAAPGDFIRRLPAPLQLATVNHLVHASKDDGGATGRLRGDEVAAIVSGRQGFPPVLLRRPRATSAEAAVAPPRRVELAIARWQGGSSEVERTTAHHPVGTCD